MTMSEVTRWIATDGYATLALHACGCVSEEPAHQRFWHGIASCDAHNAPWVGGDNQEPWDGGEDSAPAELRGRADEIPTRTLVGHVGVDSGTMYIGDPCYVIDTKLGAMTWEAFCTTYRLPSDVPMPVEDLGGGRSLGLVSPTGYGDGVYPVYATIIDGRVMALTIDFGVPA